MLAIWEYFWDWAGAPATPTADPVTPGRGSGKSHDQYVTLPNEYWEALAKRTAPHKVLPGVLQERKIRLQSEIQQILAEQQQIMLLRQTYTQILAAIKSSSSIVEMQELAVQAQQLKDQLTELETTNKARVLRAQMLQVSLEH